MENNTNIKINKYSSECYCFDFEPVILPNCGARGQNREKPEKYSNHRLREIGANQHDSGTPQNGEVNSTARAMAIEI